MIDAVTRIENAAHLSSLGDDIRKPGAGELYLRADLADMVVSLVQSGANVLLRGDSGVGKTALVRSLARAEWKPRVPTGPGQLRLVEPARRHAPMIIETNAARFIEGCYYAHDLENKMAKVLDQARDRPAILFIDPLESCLGSGASSVDPESDVANLLLPYLEKVQVIGATTPDGEARLRSRNPRLLERFTTVDVPAPDEAETREIALAVLKSLARAGTHVAGDGVDAWLGLAARFLPAREPIAAFSQLARRAAAAAGKIDDRTMRRAVADELGIAPGFVGLGTPPTYAQLKADLAEEVFGQQVALTEVADALTRYAAGLNPPRLPIASLLFAGPSGCGKTSLALATARELTGAHDALARFDMSEYADPYAARRLIEDSDTSLIGRLLARPAGVLLFDEIEKAHPSVVRLLLQALGEARLTGETGRTARLDNYVAILTTNVGARRWSNRLSADKATALVLSDIAEEFPPEFLGRLTRTVVFEPLTADTGARIVERELEALNELPGIVERGLQLIWTPAIVEALVEFGVSEHRGARGVQSAVRTLVATPLARWLAEHPEAARGMVMLAGRTGRDGLVSIVIDWVDDAGFFSETLH